ncbi:MAG: nucleotidyltransferase domain-containing protein [Calditrichaeota bacterium]|nr:nucleotidyltransferase domain-containing protein [Calditrichota bacterium]
MISEKIQIKREKIVEFCRKWKIIELSFFGSVLCNDFSEDSDVDVLVKFAEDVGWSAFDHFDAEDELSDILGRDVDLVSLSAIEEQDNWLRKRHILNSAQRYHVSG